MTRQLALILSLILSFSPCVSANPKYQAYLSFENLTHGEPIAIKELISDWRGRFRGGDAAFMQNWFEIGVQRDPWSMSYVSRYDFYIDTHRDTAEVYYLLENKFELESGRAYRAYIDVNHILAHGVRIARNFKRSKELHFNFGVSYLQGQRFTRGKVDGLFTALSDKDFEYQADVDYHYTKDWLFKRTIHPPDGHGFSIDMTVDWQASPRLNAELRIRDLFSRIYWNESPFTTAVATSDNKTFDDDGFVSVQPAISGVEAEERFEQTLWWSSRLRLRYQLYAKIEAEMHYHKTKVKDIGLLGVRYTYRSNTALSTFWGVNTESVTLSIERPRWGVSFTSDHEKLERTRTLGLSFYWRYAW